MSSHLVGVAFDVPLRPVEKLVLMRFADSASKETGIAFPGLDEVMAAAGLEKRQALRVIAKLVDGGYLRRMASAHRGRRAEFLVFPDGCCELHGKVNPDGSGVPDPFPIEVSGRPDPLPGKGVKPDTQTAGRLGVADDTQSVGKGVTKGVIAVTPLLSSELQQPPPPTSSTADPVEPRAEEEVEPPALTESLGVADFPEFVAELSVTAREVGGTSQLWTRRLVHRAVDDAIAEGYDPSAIPAALRDLAADPKTRGPARLREAGPWWGAADREAKRARAADLLEHAERKAVERRKAEQLDDARRQCQRDMFEQLADDVLDEVRAQARVLVDEDLSRTTAVRPSEQMRARLITTTAQQLAVADGLVPALDAIDITDTKAAYA